MNRKTVCLHKVNASRPPIEGAMNAIERLYRDRGWEISYWNPKEKMTQQVKGADHVYVYNGTDPRQAYASIIAKNQGSEVFFVEHGHFPQTGFFHCSREGVLGRHPGKFVNWDAVLTQEDWSKFQKRRSSLSAMRNPSRDVLVPLQVPGDSQLKHFGNGYTNRDLVIMDLGPDKWIRHHPKVSKGPEYFQLDNRNPLNQVLASYERAFGINSTVLLEASLMGLEVTCLGQSYLDWHPDPDVVCAAVLAMQIPFEADDYSPWIRPHMGLEQLGDL